MAPLLSTHSDYKYGETKSIAVDCYWTSNI